MYRIIGGVKRLSDGWEHSWEYSAFEQHPDLDPERPYLLVMLAVNPSAGESAVFYAVIPVHQPGGLWDRVLGALEPSRWAKAFALDSKYFAFQLPFILIGLDEGDTFHLMETDANGVDVKYLVR